MATVQLADIYNPVPFAGLTARAQLELNKFIESGVAVRSETLQSMVSQGGNIGEITNFQPLGTDEPNYSSDDPAVNSTPKKISDETQKYRLASQNQSWSAMDLAIELGLQDPVAAITTKIGQYWATANERRIIQSCMGILADNVANDSGDMLETVATEYAETVAGNAPLSIRTSKVVIRELLKNPEDRSSPWYPARGIGALETPEWSFDFSDLRRFPEPSASPPLSPDEPRQVSGDIVRPERIVGERYDFSESGCDLREAALFIVQLEIDREGQIGNLQFLKSSGDTCLERHIRETLGAWEFSPATLHGEPVAVFYNLTVRTHFR